LLRAVIRAARAALLACPPVLCLHVFIVFRDLAVWCWCLAEWTG